MSQLPDGSISILLRTGGNNPSYIARSTDGCKTWTKPKIFDSNGVLPQILTLKNGITLASYGRPILKVRATSDPSGIDWEEPIVLPLTESTDPRENEKPWEKDSNLASIRVCLPFRMIPFCLCTVIFTIPIRREFKSNPSWCEKSRLYLTTNIWYVRGVTHSFCEYEKGRQKAASHKDI